MRCSVDPGSPGLTAFRLGERALMICQTGRLVRIRP
jgi:hypothetical protein